MKRILCSLLLAGCSLAADITQAAPITFTTVTTGDAGKFDFFAGDRGLGDFQGIGPFTLSVSANIDNAVTWNSTVLDITLTADGKTSRMQQAGSLVSSLSTFTDSSGKAITVLSQSFDSNWSDFGPRFHFFQSLQFDPHVIDPWRLYGTGDVPLQSLGGRFSLEFSWSNDAADVGFGTASGAYDHGTLQVIGPVPEPTSYAMLIAGLAMIGSLAMRRRAGPIGQGY
ncbi:PEP-CTERM sorting domain-containing protein [[Empedobacter] haloabium]|uniref:PEP-CTERM sorting domain-containing protein n=1 Tax=[Empedobacter] haloabium TaxID=592317 RepID=A0ABZ1USE4_9BURK